MDFVGRLQQVSRDWKSGKYILTLLVDEGSMTGIEDFTTDTKLSIVLKRFSKKRSLDANGMMWAMLSEMAMHEGRDKWDLYIEKLKKHGKCYPVRILTDGLADLKAQWREIEVIDTYTDEAGISWSTCLCYPGSHLYTTAEFSKLLDDIIFDMKQDGLQPPPNEAMRRSLEIWEKSHTQH